MNHSFTPSACIGKASSHPQRDKTQGNYMAAAENSRMLRVGLNTLARRFRSSLSFPPSPKPSF